MRIASLWDSAVRTASSRVRESTWATVVWVGSVGTWVRAFTGTMTLRKAKTIRVSLPAK
jgi:hypothetical protein